MCCAAGSIWFGRVGGRGTACEQCNIMGILWQRCNTHFHSLKWSGYKRSSGAGKQGSGTQHILHSPIFLQFFFFAFFSSSFFCVSFKLLLVCLFFFCGSADLSNSIHKYAFTQPELSYQIQRFFSAAALVAVANTVSSCSCNLCSRWPLDGAALDCVVRYYVIMMIIIMAWHMRQGFEKNCKYFKLNAEIA